MRTRLKWLLVIGSVVVGQTLSVGSALATPASGFKGTTIARGTFEEFSIRTQYPLPGFGGPETDLWFSLLKTKGDSELFVQSNEWQPGGTTGWHSHPGFSLVMLIGEGTITAYEYEGDHCTAHVYSANSSGTLIDANHVHMLRNEGSVVARTVAVQLVPKAMEDQRRIDLKDPPTGPGCP
jgi:mannose-6-phosphate isomerase-like protein (cupin superfamily)